MLSLENQQNSRRFQLNHLIKLIMIVIIVIINICNYYLYYDISLCFRIKRDGKKRGIHRSGEKYSS